MPVSPKLADLEEEDNFALPRSNTQPENNKVEVQKDIVISPIDDTESFPDVAKTSK